MQVHLFSTPGEPNLAAIVAAAYPYLDHAFHPNPVLALEDNAHLYAGDDGPRLLAGGCWLLRPGRERRRLAAGPVHL